ncbi:MAG: hypothetical protein KGJ53_04940 [Alphaproteobacteria bacterium]|nr:hypothetical protein [Alphaproteobacteria bacterium]
MSRATLIAIMAITLGGCFTDQEKQVAACQIDAQKMYLHKSESDDVAAAAASISDVDNMTILCMQAHGYGFVQLDKRCPRPKSDNAQWNASFAYCYRPLGWGARQVYNLEMTIGR